MGGTATPLFTARNQLQLDHAFRTQGDLDSAVAILTGLGHKYAGAFLQFGQDFGVSDDFLKMRRSDLFLSFADQDQIDGQFYSGRLERDQSTKEGIFRTLLIDRAASHANRAQAFLLHQPGLERRRTPLPSPELFSVLHEIDGHEPATAG